MSQGTFACPICGEDTPHFHLPQRMYDFNSVEEYVQKVLEDFEESVRRIKSKWEHEQ